MLPKAGNKTHFSNTYIAIYQLEVDKDELTAVAS